MLAVHRGEFSFGNRQDDFIIEESVPLSVNEPHDHCATARSRR